MNDAMSQFRDTYITECLELLGQMEEELLELDASADSEKLNAIFRCAHSIKGGSGAFGFTAIGQFTHTLEALLDKLREGELQVSRELTDILLKARDVVLQLVIAARDGTQLDALVYADIDAELKRICGGGAAQGAAASIVASAVSEEKSGEAEYEILFRPHPSLLATGNEPLLLLRELKRLGDANIECDFSRLPDFDKVAPDNCYLSWKVALKTDKGEAAIREVFEFVEDECDLEIKALSGAAQLETQAEVIEIPVATNASAKDAKAEVTAPAKGKEGGVQTASVGAASIRVDIEKVDRLINMVGEIVIIQAMLAMQSRNLPVQQFPELVRGIEELTQHTRELQEAVMAVRMQPVKSIFARMPRIVRDLSAQLGKDIRLEMEGENTEVDKTIIEQLSDPLTHMIRNAADHGIESPETRKKSGKPAQGTIVLSAEHRGGKIVITISDDGGGINREKVLGKAKEKGVVSGDAQLTDLEIDMLIFAPGFSTAEAVTSVSGRGVGMDVVKRNIEGLGGTVSVLNNPGKGSQFFISLPLTLAILDGMVVRVADEHYIVPINNIVETLRPRADEVRNMADGNVVINVRGEFVPVIYLYQLFGVREAVTDASKGLVVLVEDNGMTLGLVVDELVGQQQVVIKSLEENSDPLDGVSGATILGDGKVSLILDIAGLQRMKQGMTQHQQRKAA